MKTRQENMAVRTERNLGDSIRAHTILSLCRKKLRKIDDEEELFKSVLITNTIKVVRQEISTTGKKGKKKIRDKISRKVKKRIESLGSLKNWKMWKYKMGSMRRIIRRKPVKRISQKRLQ